MSVNKTVSAAGTYYLICKDAAGNASSSTNKTYRSYTVNNMLLNIKGSKGTYTTANYTSASTKTYIIPNSTAITLTSIYTAPTGGTYVGTSSGAASNDSATLLTSNPTITANTTYTAWFNRNEYTITVATGGNGSVKVTSENNTTGVTATASGSNKTLTARYGEKITGTATANSGYTFTGWTSGFSGTTNPATLTVTSAVTVNAGFADKTAPSPSISTTSNLKAASQTATLKCTDGVGVTSYYWGTNASPAASDYTTITSTTSMSVNKTVSAAGTYYLICKDAAGNASSSTNKTYRSYTVNNMLLNIKGSKGTYTTANYTSASTKTYIIPNSTAITLTSIYTAPTGGTYVGTSSGAASNDSATLLTSNPTITANTTYTAWFNRNEYTITVATGGNGSVKVTSENNTTGVTATASGSNKTLTA